MSRLEALLISRQEQAEVMPHVNATRLDKGGVEITASAVELNILDTIAAGLSAAELSIMDGVTATTAELNKTDGLTGGILQAIEVAFTENGDNTLHRGDIAIPAGATLHKLLVTGHTEWGSSTAVLKVGISGGTTDGFFVGVDITASGDLDTGETLGLEWAGGKEGAFLVTSEWEAIYDASARVIRADIAVTGPSGSAGATRLLAVFSAPVSVAATPSTP